MHFLLQAQDTVDKVFPVDSPDSETFNKVTIGSPRDDNTHHGDKSVTSHSTDEPDKNDTKRMSTKPLQKETSV